MDDSHDESWTFVFATNTQCPWEADNHGIDLLIPHTGKLSFDQTSASQTPARQPSSSSHQSADAVMEPDTDTPEAGKTPALNRSLNSHFDSADILAEPVDPFEPSNPFTNEPPPIDLLDQRTAFSDTLDLDDSFFTAQVLPDDNLWDMANFTQFEPEWLLDLPKDVPGPSSFNIANNLETSSTSQTDEVTVSREEISMNQLSQKRRCAARSPTPTEDVRDIIAKRTVCFQLEMSNSGSSRPRKARRTFNKSERGKVGDVRSKRACLRCRWLKTSCDGETPCSKCVAARSSSNMRLYKGPCIRLNLVEADCFRVGNSKFFQEIAQVRPYPQWKAQAPLKTLHLIRPRNATQNWPSWPKQPTLPVTVREFHPGAGDITSERWRDATGREIILELPCLAATDNEETTRALLRWVDDNFNLYAKDMVAQGGDFIISATFDEAVRYSISRPGSLVKQALRIWIGTRMAQEFFTVQEDNDLEINMVHDPFSVHNQQCPVPPVLDHQLDVLMIVEMVKTKNIILNKMRRMIEDRRRNEWYEVYLTTFVFLSNLQYVFGKQQRWWKLHFETGIQNNIGQAVKSLSFKFMQRYDWSARNLISHFRYALRGPVPFTLNWNEQDVEQLGDLDPEAVIYVKFISNTVQRRAADLKAIFQEAKQGNLEGDLFWLCQLFLEPDIDDD